MPATDTGATPADTPLLPRRLTARLMRLSVYFGRQRLAWGLAIAATLVGALTEPLIPALLQPLLDEGFIQGRLPLWLG
ncbi:lipid ABC transporter permease/ATP-binding protein, partial [Verminephrobacter sp. Larva24]